MLSAAKECTFNFNILCFVLSRPVIASEGSKYKAQSTKFKTKSENTEYREILWSS